MTSISVVPTGLLVGLLVHWSIGQTVHPFPAMKRSAKIESITRLAQLEAENEQYSDCQRVKGSGWRRWFGKGEAWKEVEAVKCPKCGLVNPDNAWRCDCGYDFATGQIKESYLERAGQSTNRSSIVKLVAVLKRNEPISVVILSAVIAVGLLVFMWQFLMDTFHPLWTTILFVLYLSMALPIAWCWCRELGSGLNQLWRVILGFLLTPALGVIVMAVFLIAGPREGYGLGFWIDAWEGCVVEKHTYIDYVDEDCPRVYAVDLTTGHRKHLPHCEWSRVKVGDYIVKKRRSYTIEIRQKP